VFFQDRLKPDLVRVKSMVDAGTLGKTHLVSGRVKWYRPPEYYRGVPQHGTRALAGGGALINQAIHTLDLLLYVLGPISRVFARTGTLLHDIEVEDTVVATFEFANGALGSFEATTSVFPGYARRVEITGSSGTLIVEHDQIAAVDLVPGASAGANVPIVAPSASAFNAASALVADATPHQRIVEDFVRALRTGSRPICDGAEGRRSMAVIDAMYESAQSNRAVEV
jgi:predicted dehydrogenase